ncbi:hypothetical protein FDP41_012931 [Naegleria fowleri]|uniref:NADH dehydrogenase [ubiquinone] 1 alpha subcomplex subunit 6 n=1 Tax=Naegleria fowleri TaxID=5763 RepID=A0A6A5BST7_NAEFO|nr:uncharacterized protein FDP41_012931 [Naegleria fowleri]KAF0981143.1 hypothetical protein FDP41_012931 [Naegleria fowleri]CAG4717128.1 unnamed protein product [Naegleria fowleri]
MLKRAVSSSTRHLHHTNHKNSTLLLANISYNQSANYYNNYIASVQSKDLEEAKKNTLLLYRRILKILPWMRDVYHLPVNEDVLRRRIHKEFESYKGLTDLEVIDALIIRGYIEREEATMHHKQRGHVLKYFSETEVEKALPKLPEFKKIVKEKINTDALLGSATRKNLGKFIKNMDQ